MKRGDQRGFTLLELVLALSIVAAMLAIVFGGLRVGVRAWQRGEERTESQQHARSLNALLALSLGGTAAYLGPAPAGVQPEVLFQGAPDTAVVRDGVRAIPTSRADRLHGRDAVGRRG